MLKYICAVLLMLAGISEMSACTSAIISGKLTENHRPILWKHRDTSCLDNVVEIIEGKDGQIDYVALFNDTDTLREQAWIGFNKAGFAIMNTASYNLKNDTVTVMDHEGFVMAEALSSCCTVDDFEQLLKDMPKPLRVEANFGVIDALGGAAYFETDNWSYKRYNVDDTEEGYLVRTNHSKSGRKDEGFGYVREATAEYLLRDYIEDKKVTPMVFTEDISRSFYHSLIDDDFADSEATWVVDRDFIPRRISSASVAIEGVEVGQNPLATTMWTVLGYPPCGVVEPVWLDGSGIPEGLKADKITGKAPLCEQANELKKSVFSMERDNGQNYLNIKVLYNNEGTGISQTNRLKSLEKYKQGYDYVEKLLKKK